MSRPSSSGNAIGPDSSRLRPPPSFPACGRGRGGCRLELPLDTVCRGIYAGRYPQLADRDDLWRLLVVITRHKARGQIVRELRAKRGAGNINGDQDFDQFVGLGADAGVRRSGLGRGEHARLIGMLDERQRRIALDRMAGYSIAEIAVRCGYTPRWVHLQTRQIRTLWSNEQGTRRGGGGLPGPTVVEPAGPAEEVPTRYL